MYLLKWNGKQFVYLFNVHTNSLSTTTKQKYKNNWFSGNEFVIEMTERIAVVNSYPLPINNKKNPKKQTKLLRILSHGNAVQLSKTSTSTPWFFYTQLHENVCCSWGHNCAHNTNLWPWLDNVSLNWTRENKNSYYKIVTEIFHLLFFSTRNLELI